MKKILAWLVLSSRNSEEIALTAKGFAITFLPLLLFILRYFGVDNPELGSLPEQIQSFIILVGGVIGGVVTAWGLIRKIVISFQKPIGVGFFDTE